MPKCTVSTCNEPKHIIGGQFCRYCEAHHYGNQPAITRGSFNEEANDPTKGWRQNTAETFAVERDNFPVEDR